MRLTKKGHGEGPGRGGADDNIKQFIVFKYQTYILFPSLNFLR